MSARISADIAKSGGASPYGYASRRREEARSHRRFISGEELAAQKHVWLECFNGIEAGQPLGYAETESWYQLETAAADWYTEDVEAAHDVLVPLLMIWKSLERGRYRRFSMRRVAGYREARDAWLAVFLDIHKLEKAAEAVNA